MLRTVKAIISLELCEQSCAERAALCQGKIHASEAVRSAAKRARYQENKNYARSFGLAGVIFPAD